VFGEGLSATSERPRPRPPLPAAARCPLTAGAAYPDRAPRQALPAGPSRAGRRARPATAGVRATRPSARLTIACQPSSRKLLDIAPCWT